MGILGPDGHPAAPDQKEYKVGTFALSTQKPPEYFLQLAVQNAVQLMRQRDPVLAMQINNPFQIEPAAQGVFMLMAEVLASQGERIAELEAKLEGESHGAPNESTS